MTLFKALLACAVICSAMNQTAVASTQAQVNSLAAYAFEGEAGGLTLDILDSATMDDTQGQIWALPLAIIAVDFAMMGFFWGVYVPYIAPRPPTSSRHYY